MCVEEGESACACGRCESSSKEESPTTSFFSQIQLSSGSVHGITENFVSFVKNDKLSSRFIADDRAALNHKCQPTTLI